SCDVRQAPHGLITIAAALALRLIDVLDRTSYISSWPRPTAAPCCPGFASAIVGMQQMREPSVTQILSCLLILLPLGGSPCWAGGDIEGTVENGSRTSSGSGDARGQAGVVGKLGSRSDKSSTDTTWSQGLTLGPNGPIPWIVVDQFGYPTKASKMAVIRDPQVGYDSAAHFTPGPTYGVVDRSTGKIVKTGPLAAWNGGATDDISGDKLWWFDFSDVTTA